MTDLNDASIEELEAELQKKKREAAPGPPTPVNFEPEPPQHFDPEPNKCDCEGWCYDDPKAAVWGYVEDGGSDRAMRLLGHHPSCQFYLPPPPHEVLTGLAPVKADDLPRALAELALAYQHVLRDLAEVFELTGDGHDLEWEHDDSDGASKSRCHVCKACVYKLQPLKHEPDCERAALVQRCKGYLSLEERTKANG